MTDDTKMDSKLSVFFILICQYLDLHNHVPSWLFAAPSPQNKTAGSLARNHCHNAKPVYSYMHKVEDKYSIS